MSGEIAARLEYLRGEIEAERISYGEIAELQSLARHIDPGDVQLLQWAGVEEAHRHNFAFRRQHLYSRKVYVFQCRSCGDWADIDASDYWGSR